MTKASDQEKQLPVPENEVELSVGEGRMGRAGGHLERFVETHH
jgi:hypothetical protein